MIILKNLFYTVIMILCCIFINQTAYFLFGYSSTTFHIIIPINEETLRLISVIKGTPLCWMFTTFIVIHEFITYTDMIKNSVGHLSTSFLLIRVLCAVFHFTLLSIQFYGWKLYKKENKKIYIIGSYIFTIGLHYTWNAKIALLFIYFI